MKEERIVIYERSRKVSVLAVGGFPGAAGTVSNKGPRDVRSAGASPAQLKHGCLVAARRPAGSENGFGTDYLPRYPM